jgi:hypothetical protein
MKTFAILGAAPLAAALLFGLTATTDQARAGGDLKCRAVAAVEGDYDSRQDAIEALRAAGPAGLEALLTVHADKLSQRQVDSLVGKAEDTPEWLRLSEAINQVAGQHDAHASRLYWYTDIEAAKAAARESGRPILSLHMLGKLTQECSCANSRFFRTVLYANEEVSKCLRENFVLHWHSVRPVPLVTIDFGDGRVLRRTLTGNSVHYVLDADGRPIEAIPGLYGPQFFQRLIERARNLNIELVNMPVEQRPEFLREWHRQRGAEAVTQWQADLAALGEPTVTVNTAAGPNLSAQRQLVEVAATIASQRGARQEAPQVIPAVRPTLIARPKGDIELPVLAGLGLADRERLAGQTDDATWQKIAVLHSDQAKLDAGSRALMAEHVPATAAMSLAVSKALVETPLLKMVRNLQNSTALDTVQNEYLRHTTLHRWFAEGTASDLTALNERVYAEVFLTPKADPWLGLVPPDTYTAIDDNGLVEAGGE